MTASSRKKSTGPVLPPPLTVLTSPFSSRFPTFFHRSTSPTRAGTRTGQAVKGKSSHQQKRTCMCSPSTHPGSFRCSLHKSSGGSRLAPTSPYSLNRLKARRSAMTNSLAGIRGVEGGLVKRSLAALIRPSLLQKQRRSVFRPRPSRLSAVSKGEGDS